MARDRIRDAVTIITGASSGIGRATAVEFARAGARLVLAARSADRLESLKSELGGAADAVITVPTDVTREADVRRLVEHTLDRFGRVDIAVCNAGIYIRSAVKDLPLSAIEQCMNVNFYGTVHLIRAVLPLMLAQRSGHIVALTSVDGRKGLPPDGAYVASKSAATGFMDVLRQELRGTGVYASTILPGRVDTPMIDRLDVPAASAKISSTRVARAVVRAVRTRRRELVIPFMGPKTLIVAGALWPAAGDWLVRLFKLEGKER
jgi:NAD(P)-dependent dehydrogenase (short-subunit alcohol dehydrogenase family)